MPRSLAAFPAADEDSSDQSECLAGQHQCRAEFRRDVGIHLWGFLRGKGLHGRDDVLESLVPDVVVAGVLDGEKLLGAAVLLVDRLAIGEGNDGVVGAVDDKEGLIDVADTLVVLEFVTRKKRDAGDREEGGTKRGKKDESAGGVSLREPAGRTRADRLAEKEDLLRGDLLFGIQEMEGGVGSLISTAFTGRSVAESVSGVVVGEDGKPLGLELGEEGGEGAQIFGIAVRPKEDRGIGAGTGIPEGCNLPVPFRREHSQMGRLDRVLSRGRLKDELVGESAGHNAEGEVDECKGFEGAFPIPFAQEKFFPIHDLAGLGDGTQESGAWSAQAATSGSG